MEERETMRAMVVDANGWVATAMGRDGYEVLRSGWHIRICVAYVILTRTIYAGTYFEAWIDPDWL